MIGIGGAVWVFNEHRAVMLGLGIAALVGGIAFYAVSFLLFERDNKWNFRALATFGLFLVLAGIFLPFSRSEFWILSCACAVACCCVARAFVLPTLGLHGAVYLLLGSAAAGATSQPLPVLFAIGAGPVEWLASIGVLLAAAVSWVAIAGISSGAPGHWRNQISSLALAAHVVWITAGLAVYAVLAMWRTAVGRESGSVPADTLGTVVLTGLSLALAWAGTHWRKPELVWLLYGFMALGGYKLAIRDFINEHNLASGRFASLLRRRPDRPPSNAAWQVRNREPIAPFLGKADVITRRVALEPWAFLRAGGLVIERDLGKHGRKGCIRSTTSAKIANMARALDISLTRGLVQ